MSQAPDDTAYASTAQAPQQDNAFEPWQRGDARMGLVASEGREFARVVDSRGTAEEFSGARERYAQQQRPRAVRRDDVDGGRSMADHPLFRGLLEELPARNAAPSQEWLDRWASTARSILDLLYSRDPLT